MEYNELFETEEACKKTLSCLFNFKLGNVPIKVYKVDVSEPIYSFFECLKYEIPYVYTIRYTIGLEDGSLMTNAVLKVPKMKDGSFIIEGTELIGGVAVRTPVNLIRIDRPIGVFTKGKAMTISSNNFSFKIEKAAEEKATITIKEGFLKDSPQKKYCLGSYFKNNGLGYKVGDLTLAIDESDPTDYPTIRVDKRVRDQIEYLLGYELNRYNGKLEPDDKNIYIFEPKDIYNFWYLANTNLEKVDRVSPFDLNFGDTGSSILRHFKHNIRMRTQIFAKWNRTQSKSTEIYTDPVQRYVDSYFRMQSESSKDLQVANDTNALDQLSQQRKCYLAKSDGEKVPISYGADFIGIIDPGKTHEGGATSKRNELARGIKITEDGVKVRLIDAKTNNLVWVDLITHYKSSILSTTSWDYEDNKLVLNDNGKIQILQKGKYSYVDPDFKYQYRRVNRDDILGYGDASIPMMNATDHTRVALGTSQLDQSIPTIGSKPPIVATGVEKTIYEISNLNIKSEVDGVVENVTEEYVKIKTSKGFKAYQIPKPIHTRAHTNQFFFPTVKIGDKIKKGDIIIEINSFRHGQLALATPLKVAYTDYELGTFEDSTIISESAAKKLGHKAMISIDIPIVESSSYLFGKEVLGFRSEYTASESSEFQYLNDLMLPNIGDKVSPGQLIFTYLYETDEDLDKVMRLRRLISPESKIYKKAIKRIPKNVQNGIVKDIVVTIKDRENGFVNEIYDYYDMIQKDKDRKQQEDIGYVIPKADKSKYLRSDQIAMISIEIEYINSMKIGDKASNRFGTKGLIKMILPDDQMPKLPNGEPLEMIIGAESVMSRKNIAQIYELAISQASVNLWNKSKDIIESSISEDSKRKKLIEILNTLYITERFTNYTYEELLKEFYKFDGYYQVIVAALDNKYMKQKNMAAIMKLADMPLDGKYILTIGNKKTKKPVVCGISYVERLHFIAELKSKSTSSRGGNKKSDLAIGSGGQVKPTGQRLGNNEVYALQAYGTMDLLEHLRQEEASHGHDIQQELNMLGLAIVAADEY